MGGDVDVTALARDLVTRSDGTAHVIGTAALHVVVSPLRELLAVDHRDERLAELVGRRVAGGFRGRVAAAVPDEVAAGSVLHQLLDDLPGACLVNGYAGQRDGSWDGLQVPVEHVAGSTDLCAGWASDASILVAVRAHGTIPVPTTATVALAARDDIADDPDAWHERPQLAATSSRRSRRLDLVADGASDGSLAFDAHFRDSYVDVDDGEGALHEYSVRGRFAPERQTIVAIEGQVHVLPWTECPAAIASVQRVVGMPVAELRARVREELVGTSTCTHLNDVLRSLADLPVLAAAIR
jgi:hypothetical protein